jgi:hypothetical protein
VIGCSGRTAFSPEDVEHLSDGAILASASSGAIEFATDDLLAFACAPVPADIHSTLHLRLFGRDVVLLNGGFPVDFDGSLSPVPPSLIQLTRALMLGGALQAHSATRPGIASLDPSFSAWVERRFAQLVSSEAIPVSG